MPEAIASSRNSIKLYVKHNLLISFTESVSWPTFTTSTRYFVGFLDYIDTIPTFTNRYNATWYSDEDCTQTIEPENFVSGNRYFVKLTEINYQEDDTVTLVESSEVTKTNIVLEVA